MEFINHTPFGAAAYRALDVHALVHDVVALRTEYRLVPRHDGDVSWLVPQLVDEDAPALLTEDRYRGAVGASAAIAESDLAPYKPRCDVLLAGAAHAPWGRNAPTWLSRLRVSHEARLLLDKTLRVHGPRRFIHRTGSWALEPAAATTRVAIAPELAYGGLCWLGHEQPEVNYTNPLGCGWWHPAWFDALARAGAPPPQALPAPQWEGPDDPITAPDFTPQPAGPAVPQMTQIPYAHRPAGFGAVGRAWTPRIQLAGSYDDTWLKWSWPQLPRDFDMAHWCCAPVDQQIEGFLPPDAVIELAHLVPPVHCPSGHAVIRLPGSRPWLVLRLASGLLVGAEPVIDTVLIDTERLTLTLTWRASVRTSAGVLKAELGWQNNPDGPLFKLAVAEASLEVALG